jgi:hypothetical protein
MKMSEYASLMHHIMHSSASNYLPLSSFRDELMRARDKTSTQKIGLWENEMKM